MHNSKTIILPDKILGVNASNPGVRKYRAGSLRSLWFVGSICAEGITRELPLHQTLRTPGYKQEVMVLERWLDGKLIAGVGLVIRSGVMSLEVHWEVRSREGRVEKLPKAWCLSALPPLAALVCSCLCVHNASSED